MAVQNVQFLKFNHGLISRYALARVDLEHLRYGAAAMTNWMPRVFGTMMLRPGMEYKHNTRSNGQVKTIPFLRSSTDASIIECFDSGVRFIVNEAAIVRPTVTSTITNPGFDTDLSGWTSADEAGATSSWIHGDLLLHGAGFNAAIRYQTVTVAGANINVEHGLRIHVLRGPAVLRVGSTVGGDEYIRETILGSGYHSLALTPTGNFTIQFSNRFDRGVFVDSCDIEAAGQVTLPTPWDVDAFPNLRWDQSADVVYVGDGTSQQQKIEHRSDRSWSIVKYEPDDGPFRSINISRVTLTPSLLTGLGTLTASSKFFRDGHVGALFRLIGGGQFVRGFPGGDEQFTDPIEVTGVGDSRKFTIDISGTWASTLHLQRSLGAPGAWVNVQTYTNGSSVFDDKLDNQIAYYRVGFASGDYASGSATVKLVFGGGSITGICRVTDVLSDTVANMTVIRAFGALDATDLWYEGAWSEYRGFPSEPRLHEGRLWWLGGDKYFGSVSDGYESYDDSPELTAGGAGAIIRSVGQGPVATINWSVSASQLLAGTSVTELLARSTSIDEPMTPTNFNIKYPTNQGSARIAACKIDDAAVFVQRGLLRIYQMTRSTDFASQYGLSDLTALVPELALPGIAQIVVQRQPDTRLHVRRTDGTAFMLVFDALENVKCWIDLELSGVLEDICILPGAPEDSVYYIIRRVINSTTYRYYEKWAMESECVGGTLNKQADSFLLYQGAATHTISVPHLLGEEVVVWADGKDYSPGSGADQKTYTVDPDTGLIRLDDGVTVSNAVVGLPYTAQFKGVKLAYAAQGGSALGRRKRVVDLSLVLADTHYQGLRYGPNFTDMDNLPLVENGAVIDADTVHGSYDNDSFTFNGDWLEDSRVCLEAQAPRPVKVMAMVVGLDTKG